MNKKAFTLIELLVVIAVLAGFMALLVPNYMQARMKSRDVRRKSDLKSIQKALELYKQNNTLPEYPLSLPAAPTSPSCTNAFTDINGQVLLAKTPYEPLTQCGTYSSNAANYYYARDTIDFGKYSLYACLENGNDSEAVPCPLAFGSTGFSCNSPSKCYQLTEP
jgi:prepilin-type N-terminal cleavage/methylation domain-containing protein